MFRRLKRTSFFTTEWELRRLGAGPRASIPVQVLQVDQIAFLKYVAVARSTYRGSLAADCAKGWRGPSERNRQFGWTERLGSGSLA